ncbi:MAG: hypothetical protein QM679_03855 [Patulibacter sp.]
MSTRSSTLSHTTTAARPRGASLRSATLPLDTQAAYKFALAIVVGLGALLANLAVSAGTLILIVAILVAGRALTVIGATPEDRSSFRPTGEAAWDATLATAWGILALVQAFDGAPAGVLVAGGGAATLALLRLRTRYVISP